MKKLTKAEQIAKEKMLIDVESLIGVYRTSKDKKISDICYWKAVGIIDAMYYINFITLEEMRELQNKLYN